jgi:hypothetical protein
MGRGTDPFSDLPRPFVDTIPSRALASMDLTDDSVPAVKIRGSR